MAGGYGACSCCRLLLGCIRLYLEPDERVPEANRRQHAPAVLEVSPEQARAEAKRWRRAGYRVAMVAL
jgi:hypothetical protein